VPNRHLRLLILLALACLLPAASRRARASESVTGAFPLLEASARGAALAGNLSALAEGSESVLYNPAGLLAESQREVSFSYADLFNLGLVSHSAVLFDWPVLGHEISWENGRIRKVPVPPPARYALGLGVSNLRGDLGTDSYSEMQFALALAWRLPWKMRAGATYRYLSAQSDLPFSGGHGFALDLGWSQVSGPVTLGLTAANLVSGTNWAPEVTTSSTKTGEEDDPLLRRWSLGVAWRPAFAPVNLTAQSQWVGSAFRWQSIGGGAEWYGPLILRAGLRHREDALGGRTDFSAGAGFKLKMVRLDYAWQNSGWDLGPTHRWSGSVAL
jgi:hypothetical protein